MTATLGSKTSKPTEVFSLFLCNEYLCFPKGSQAFHMINQVSRFLVRFTQYCCERNKNVAYVTEAANMVCVGDKASKNDSESERL